MYLKIKDKKIEIKELKTFKDKFKSLKFVFEPIDYGIKISNKHLASTYFFCQRIDICYTDNDNLITYLHENIKSEKNIFHTKKGNIYYLPLNTVKNLKIGEKLNIKN